LLKPGAMIKYYLLLFVRNARRQKIFSFINVLGLSVGMASAILMYLYVSSEFNHDRFHEKADRIYRVNQTFIWGEGNNHQFASTGPGVSFAVESEIPEVEQIVRVHTPGDFLISYTHSSGQVTSIDQEKVLAADSNFFSVFTFPLLKGNPATALQNPQTLVMTESTARKYFGDEEPLGKIVRLGEGEQQQNFEVTGVIQDIPDNSYISFDIMLSMTSFPVVKKLAWSWIWTQVETFVVLKPGSSIENARARLADIPRKYAATTLERVMNMSFDDYLRSGKQWDLFLQPFTEIHLPKEIVYNRLNDAGNIKVVYALIASGIVMVLLSCINFMNLSTSQYVRRAKETSVRKILGSARSQLSASFFTEAFLFCVISLIIGVCLVQIVLPLFNVATGKLLHLSLLNDWKMIAGLGVLLLIMGLLCGSYPAFFLTRFSPVEAMRGKFKTGNEGKLLRNGMVVFQFSISIALIIFTGVVSQQLRFSADKDLGFDKENLLVLERAEWANGEEAFVSALTQLPGVMSASWCSSVPPYVFGGDKFSGSGSEKTVSLNFAKSDENYLPALGVKLLLGRNFSKDIPGDSGRVILNQKAVQAFGWTVDESVIGKKVEIPGAELSFEVIGVTDDYHYWSLLTPIEPMAIFHIKHPIKGSNTEFVLLRMEPQSTEAWQSSLASIQKTWKQFAGDNPFQYSFVDQEFANAFKSTTAFGQSLSILSGLAILIASLGLLGMIIYTLEQRTKEIGIRKVSGASVFNIVTLISKDYTRLIVTAFFVSAPLAYWVIQQWLQDFEYRVTPSISIFILSGMGTLVLAFVITSYHSIKAASRNPVEVLRDE
jgi:putative ABC transport system permease protein